MKINISRSMHQSLSMVYRHSKIMHDKSMKQFRLSGQQMTYLRIINENPGISQEVLARQMEIDKGAVAKSIKDMVDKGYVKRIQNPQDKRAYCLSTTEMAAAICKDGEVCAIKFEKELTEGLTEKELETLAVLLEKITDNMKRIMEKGDI